MAGGASDLLLLGGELFIAGHLSLQMQGVERQAESDNRQYREHHQEAAGHGRTSRQLGADRRDPGSDRLRHLLLIGRARDFVYVRRRRRDFNRNGRSGNVVHGTKRRQQRGVR